MKKGNSDPALTPAQKAELEALAAMPDEQINKGDLPEQCDWQGAKRGVFFRPVKKARNRIVSTRMRTSATLIAVVLLLLLCSTTSRAKEFCPASVVTEQQAVTVPKNYQAFRDSNIEDPIDPNRLYMVQLFDGKPSLFASIRADKLRNNMLIWNLRNLEPNAVVWIDCYYTNTEINLAEKLPSSLSSCTVYYVDAAHVFIQGEPVIKSVECQ